MQHVYATISVPAPGPDSTTMSPLVQQPHLDAWRALLNAHATMIRRIEEALSEAGLPPLAWYDVLWPVYEAPDRRLRMRDLAERVVTISRTGLTRLVDRIVDAGMLERQPTPGDRRGTEVVITERGADLLRKMWPVYAGVVNAHFADQLPKSRAEALKDALRRIG
jgi:DNA-binding MarR family transcriptional regulator